MAERSDEFECVVTAPVNIALIKYWGKRDTELILPYNDSLSLSLDEEKLGTKTTIEFSTDYEDDTLNLNGKDIEISERLANIIDELRRLARKEAIKSKMDASKLMRLCRYRFRIKTENNMPTAAGLASSASGLAAVTFGLAVALGLESKIELSGLARQGSGSACRSMFGGLVHWNRGMEENGSDSIANQVFDERHWPELKFLVLVVSGEKKKIGSTGGMQRSVETSKIMQQRAVITKDRIDEIKWAYQSKNFSVLAETTMKDSNQLHAICLDSYPPIHYLNDTSFQLIDFVTRFNEICGETKLAYTFDAGPNCFLLMEEKTVSLVSAIIQECFLKDHSIRFGSAEKLEIPKKFEALLSNFVHCKGTVAYAIESGVGSGPKIIKPKTPLN